MASNYTLDDIAQLEAALATGVLRVTHNGVTTEFRSRDDMIKQISLMKGELGIVDTGAPSRLNMIRRLRFLGTKGL